MAGMGCLHEAIVFYITYLIFVKIGVVYNLKQNAPGSPINRLSGAFFKHYIISTVVCHIELNNISIEPNI